VLFVTLELLLTDVPAADAAFSHPAMTQTPLLCVRFCHPTKTNGSQLTASVRLFLWLFIF
jgi:hypothetical protein